MKLSTKKLATLAMLAAAAYMLVFFIRIPIVPLLPFLKYEPKDVAITIGGFLFGPLASFLISLVVSLVEMVTISDTGPVGGLMNLLSTCSFACTAAFIYKKKRSLSGAMIGLTVGTVVMAAAMLLWNWLITPMYMKVSREAIEALLLPGFLPFNLLKAGLNCALTMALYKPLTNALRKTGLLPERPGSAKGSPIGMYLFMAILLITCTLLILTLKGII